MQDRGVNFTVVDRKKMRKGTTERYTSKQQALRGTGVNIDCRWAPPGIAKLWVSLRKQSGYNGHNKSEVLMNHWRAQAAGNNNEEKELKELLYNTYKIYGPQERIKTLSDPGHWEKNC